MRNCLLLILLLCLTALTAQAEEALSVQEVFETVAVPLALANDDGAIVNEEYSAEDLRTILQALKDNGHEVDARLDWLARIDEGYWEEETLMAICRKAFGGVLGNWTPEEQHWFGEMTVAIRFASENLYQLPEEEDLGREEALNQAVTLLSLAYGEGETLPLLDETLYRIETICQMDTENEEDGAQASWYLTFYPRTLKGSMYHISMRSDGLPESMFRDGEGLPENYTISELISALNEVYYRQYHSQSDWTQEGWVQFAALLKDADTSETIYHPEYTAFLAADYPAEDSVTLTREEAVEKARLALGLSDPWLESAVLTSAGKPVWVVVLEDEKHVSHLVEIDAEDDSAVFESATENREYWAMWVPHECYEAAMGSVLGRSEAIARGAEAIRALAGMPDLPLEDPDCFRVDTMHNTNLGVWNLTFVSKKLEWGRFSVRIDDVDGLVLDWTVDTAPLNGDNIVSRFYNAYGWWGSWEQSTWVELGETARTLTAETMEGVLLTRTEYLPESEAYITREEAIRIATEADSPSGHANEANSCILLGDNGYPVWKLRMLYGDTPGTTLYEVDGMTGKLLDVQKFVTDNPDVNPTCMIYTLHKTFAQYQIETRGEEGVVWLAQDALTKAIADLDFDDPTVPALPQGVTHEDGWQVELQVTGFAEDGHAGERYVVWLTEEGVVVSVELKAESEVQPGEA